jgi:hypothetical protein
LRCDFQSGVSITSTTQLPPSFRMEGTLFLFRRWVEEGSMRAMRALRSQWEETSGGSEDKPEGERAEGKGVFPLLTQQSPPLPLTLSPCFAISHSISPHLRLVPLLSVSSPNGQEVRVPTTTPRSSFSTWFPTRLPYFVSADIVPACSSSQVSRSLATDRGPFA